MKRMLLLIALSTLAIGSNAQSYNAQYAKDVIFTEPYGVNHNTYFLYLEVNTSSLVTAGKMQADGDDIRFVTDCGQNSYLDYYIHRGMNSSKTEVYINVGSLDSAETDTIQMLYGDANAAAGSNFNATFPNAIQTNGSNITRGGLKEVGWVEVDNGDVLNIATDTLLELRAAYIKIDGDINGVSDGYQAPTSAFTAGNGSGGGTSSSGSNAGSGGGAYGGAGGNGGYDSGDSRGMGGSAYGSRTSQAIRKGSSGGKAASTSNAGDGGGAIILRAAKIEINGDIEVDGQSGNTAAGQCSGGGAGGGILILGDSVNISSSSTLSADGGNGVSGSSSANDGGGGGGGGRIKVFGDTYRSTGFSSSVTGGSGGTGGGASSGLAGGAGTTYFANWTYPSNTVGSELSAAPFAIQATLDTVCPGVSTTLSVTNPGSVTWSTGATSSSITVTPGVTADYYVYGTSSSGCNTSDTFRVIVDAPVVDLGPDTNSCGPKTIDAGSEVGVAYSWNTGASTSSILIQQTGTYHVTATRGGCSSIDTLTLTIDTIPIVTLSLSDDSICKLDSVVLTGNPAGGTASGIGVSGMSFQSQNLNAPAVYTQYYSFTDANGCNDRDTTEIFVQAIPVVTLTSQSNFSICIGDTTSLSGTPLGGTYSGSGVLNDQFITNLSGVGTFNVVYSFTDSVGCTATDADSMVVHALPTPQLTILDDTLCFGDNTSLLGSPGGGQFRGPGVIFNGFDSRSAGAGVHDIRYYYRDQFRCEAEDTLPLVVHALPNVDFSFGSDTICENTSTNLTGSPSGGTFTGNGVNGSVFDANGIGVGFRNVTYDYTDMNGCANSTRKRILIVAAPRNIDLTSSVDSMCLGESAILSGTPTGGTYSGSGVTDTVFSSQGLSPGLFMTYYTYSNAAGCSGSDSTGIWINSLPAVNLSVSPEEMCLGDSAVISPNPLGGTLSGMGVVDTMFYSDSTGAGTWTITYDYIDANSCEAQATTTVIVSSCAGIDEADVKLIELYPNPSDGTFYLRSIERIESAKLLDAQGRNLKHVDVDALNNGALIQLDALSSGIYFLQVGASEKSQTLRLIVR